MVLAGKDQEGLRKEEEGGIVFQPEGTCRKAWRHTVCSTFLTSQEPNLGAGADDRSEKCASVLIIHNG